MNDTLVSVIVPNYNYAQYLPQRLGSILNQTYEKYEIILLDDASTDHSMEVLQPYVAYPQVTHCVVNEQNTGSPFQQWMKGILLARGEWIWIAEADDFAAPTFLEECIRQLKIYPRATVCMTASCFVDENGNIMAEEANYWKDKWPVVEAYCFDGHAYNEHNMYWNNCIINASGVLFRREAALKLIQSPCLQMRYSGDWLFWFELLQQGAMIEIYKKLNFFRQHRRKVSVEGVETGKRIVEDIEVIAHMEEALSNLNPYKRSLVRGMLVRKIKHIFDENKRQDLFAFLSKRLGGGMSDYYTLRMNAFLRLLFPKLLTLKRDRLSPAQY